MKILVVWLVLGLSLSGWSEAWPPITRRLPPKGISVAKSDLDGLKARLTALQTEYASVSNHPLAADVEVYLKAVDLALVHGEFYKRDHTKLAGEILDGATSRLNALRKNQADWTQQRGLVVRGYRSGIDDSAQPYGLEIPKALDLSKPVPLYVWLHGRGDKKTDMHFISERESKPGQFQFRDGIVVHPFGRQCVGFKHAGEVDVLDVIAHVSMQYQIDPDRIALMGFSMGGAGVWHIGAHYTQHFAAVHAGAGFAETAKYNRLKPEDYPAAYEQTLWGVYDVPNYVRNLFNVPVVAYSGEIDKQIQAARVMEAAFVANGRKLPHVIGPGMGHKYHADSKKEIAGIVGKAVKSGRNTHPKELHLQTQTLRYNKMHWVKITGLNKHWIDTRVDARRHDNAISLTTTNVSALEIRSPWPSRTTVPSSCAVTIDQQKLKPKRDCSVLKLVRVNGVWQEGILGEGLHKTPGLQGPIDDAFMRPFLVVTPDAKPSDARLAKWLAFELAHFRSRWTALMRGRFREKMASQVTTADIKQYNLILWGTPETNAIMKRLLPKTPVHWRKDTVSIGSRKWAGTQYVPQLIYPNPESPHHYIVINSGLTFREHHDRTNSLQNPKLADWAIIDLTTPPTGDAPGKITTSAFFNEHWQPE